MTYKKFGAHTVAVCDIYKLYFSLLMTKSHAQTGTHTHTHAHACMHTLTHTCMHARHLRKSTGLLYLSLMAVKNFKATQFKRSKLEAIAPEEVHSYDAVLSRSLTFCHL